jgi:hypothetical protein
MAELIGPGYYRFKVAGRADEERIKPLVSQYLSSISTAIKVASEKSVPDKKSVAGFEKA